MVAEDPIDSAVEQFVEDSLVLSVPAERQQLEAMDHRNEAAGPVAVVQVDYFDAHFSATGDMEFRASFEPDGSGRFNEVYP